MDRPFIRSIDMVGTRKVVIGALSALLLVPAGDAGAAIKKRKRLKAFASCASLVAFGERNVERFGGPVVLPGPRPFPAPMPGPAAGGDQQTAQPVAAPAPAESKAGAGSDFSTTNVQEEGVDEPDFVKSDGRVIHVLRGKGLHAVAARGELQRLGYLELGTDPYAQREALLRGDRLLVLETRFEATGAARAASSIAYVPGRSFTVMTEIDVSDPANMRIVRRQEVEGMYVAARLNGAVARVVVGSTPRAYAEQARRDELAGYMPRTRTIRGRAASKRRALTSCTRVRRPEQYSGAGMTSVLTIDLERGLPAVDVDSIMSDAQTVYGSQGSLFVATQRTFRYEPDVAPPSMRTAIHRFSAKGAETEYRGSGEVPGYLLNQFSLSERNGFLRVASTEAPLWWGGAEQRRSESFVSTLDVDDGQLTPAGRVGGLGKGERIYSVRFLDDVGYVVTFRQVDPLYTVDLSQPAAPKVLGELKVLGYSAYLHPVGKDLVLGVGQDASEEGRTQGAQLQLFDVADLAAPKLLHKRLLGQWSSSEAEYDHKAFLHWPATKLAVLPVNAYGGNEPFVGAMGFRVDAAAGIEELGRVTHPRNDVYDNAVRRSAVVGDRLFTFSQTAVKTSRLDSLADESVLALSNG